ncbi:hypothetical protein FXO37_17889 [Capsicum annuum]|nr:hypothetical protein FXO37_17889 [Capsicum annuum]
MASKAKQMINGSVVLRKKTPLNLGSRDVAHEAYEILGDLPNENLQNATGCLVNNDMIPCLSDDEISLENVFVKHDLAHRAELSLEGNPATLLDSSRKRPCLYYLSQRCGRKNRKGDMKEHTDQERIILDRSTSGQNSIKDVSTAVKMDLTTNEFVHSGVSVESVKSSKDENLSKIHVMGLIL